MLERLKTLIAKIWRRLRGCQKSVPPPGPTTQDGGPGNPTKPT